jgi:amino acid transporter
MESTSGTTPEVGPGLGPAGDSETRLQELGYRQELDRGIPVIGNIALTMSNVSPTMAVFLFVLAPLAVTGTATAGGAILLSIGVVFIGLCLAELGSVYPVAGGLYSLVRFVLPRPLAFLVIINFLLQAFIFPPGIALGVAQYLQDLFPGLPQSSFATSGIAALALLAALTIGLRNIRTNAIITGSFLVLELVVLSIFTFSGFSNPAQSLSHLIFSPERLSGSALMPVGFGIVLMAIGATFGAINGYDAALGFTEETKGSSRNVGIAVTISAILTGALITIPVLASLVGAPDLANYLAADSPFLYTARETLGGGITNVMNAGIVIAAFNALILIIIYMARVLFTTGRDRVFPDSVNRFLTQTNKRKAPWVTVLIISMGSIVLVFASNLIALITFVGVLVASVYLLIAIAAVYSRYREPKLARPFRMPLFPLPPIIVGVVTITAIATQSVKDIGLAAAFGVAFIVYYYAYVRPRDQRERKAMSPRPTVPPASVPPAS